MASTQHVTDRWAEVQQSISEVMSGRMVRSEISLDASPAPAKLATFTTALLADVDVAGDEVASGRLVILHEPKGHESWDGNVRFVGFVRADLETELVTDSLLLEVGWTWVQDALNARGLHPIALSGTVSRAGSQSFGDIAEREPEGSVEIRVSWTVPESEAIETNILAWCDMLSSTAGLEPLPDGVSSITRSGPKLK
jgi:hypothetical protein